MQRSRRVFVRSSTRRAVPEVPKPVPPLVRPPAWQSFPLLVRRLGLLLLLLPGLSPVLSGCSPKALLQPRWLVQAGLSWRSPRVVYYTRPHERVVALSIDDAPDPQTTPEILKVLDEHDAHATFFVISDQAEGHGDLLNAIVAQGSELGNHGTKERAAASLSLREFERDLLDADRLIAAHGTVLWYRPGSGLVDRPMLNILEHHGYRCALADVYPLDTALRSSRFACAYISWSVRPGSIILLHDRDDRGHRTAETLRRLLPILRRRGFRVLSLSELVETTLETTLETTNGPRS